MELGLALYDIFKLCQVLSLCAVLSRGCDKQTVTQLTVTLALSTLTKTRIEERA